MIALFIAFFMALWPSHSTTTVTPLANLDRLQITTIQSDTSDPTGDNGHIPPLPTPPNN